MTVAAPVPATTVSATIPASTVAGLSVGNHTVFVRARDAAGSWSATASAVLTITTPVAIFSNGFEGGVADLTGVWSSRSTTTTSRLNVAGPPAAQFGTFGLQAQGNNTNYVQYNFGTPTNPATATFDARFYFNPNNNASAGHDILSAATNNGFGTQVFRVRYRRNLGLPQVQIQVGGGNANATWSTITNASTRIEVVRESGTSLKLYVNGILVQTLTTASAGSVGAFRLGSVTSGGSATLEYFDNFSAKRSVTPLFGP
jgi:hypothetical protein